MKYDMDIMPLEVITHTSMANAQTSELGVPFNNRVLKLYMEIYVKNNMQLTVAENLCTV
jgi:hypothetical protein